MTAATGLAGHAAPGVRAEAGAPPARFGPRRREVRAFLELFALAGLAITQPALDLLGKNTGILVTRDASALDVIAVTLLVTFLPAIVAYTAEVLVGLVVPRVRSLVHALACGVFAAALAQEVLKKSTSLTPQRLVHLGVLLGIAGAVLVLRFEMVRQWLRYLAVAPVAFALIFLLSSPASGFVLGGKEQKASGAEVTKPARVVMLVFDEFPLESLLDGTGHVDAQLYPNFARLAAMSTWYRNENTVAPYTERAVPAILTGQYPVKTGLPVAADHPHNLFTLLGGALPLNVHEAVTALCPKTLCAARASDATGWQRLRMIADDTTRLWQDFAAPHTTSVNFGESDVVQYGVPQTRDFLASLRPGERPGLDFVHIELPHEPWHLLRSLQDNEHLAPQQGASKLVWMDKAWPAMSGRQQHLIQLQATDTLLGQTLDRLERLHALDRSLLVVTADHGVAFEPKEGIRSVTGDNFDEIMWTPLFIKAPGQKAGVIDDRPAQSVDVMPTIADHLGVRIPWKVDGVSLLGKPRAEFPRRMYQYVGGAFAPPNSLEPKRGMDHIEFDGVAGFRRVLGSQPVLPGPDRDLRVYRVGPFADLMGRPVSQLTVGPQSTSPNRVSINDDRRLDAVDPKARNVPWTYLEGYLNGITQDLWLAVSVNGRVAGLTQGLTLQNSTNGFWTASLAPQLFRNGANDVTVYAIRGTPEAPVLEPIDRLRGDGG